jgi:hypothetical protein
VRGTGRLIVGVEIKKGDIYAVCLTDEQQAWVRALIEQMHGGSIKILKMKLPLEFKEKPKPKRKKAGPTA